MLKQLFFLCFICLGNYIVIAQNSTKNNLVLLKNQQNLLPILDLEKQTIHLTNLVEAMPVFNKTMAFYKKPDFSVDIVKDREIENMQVFRQNAWLPIPKNKKANAKNSTKNLLLEDQIAVVSYVPNTKDSAYLQYLHYADSLLQDFAPKVIFVHFGTAKSLPAIEHLRCIRAIVIAQDSSAKSQSLAAQMIFGAVVAQGNLTDSLRNYPKQYALDMPQLSRLQYVSPEEVGLSVEKLAAIDSIVLEALQQKAVAGCQVLVAKNGKVFYHKPFGYHTYDSLQAVTLTDMYDLASITKIAAGTLALMKLTENKQIDLDKPLSNYLTEFKKSNKKDIILREMYAHQAKLPAGIATWHSLSAKQYQKTKSKIFSIQVADSLFTKPEIATIILQNIKNVALLPKKQYLYSDIPFILTTFLVKKIAKQNLDEFVQQYFYKSLGANLVFNPLTSHSKTKIIPTEYDSLFRKQQIHGTVHDEIAALLGGVSAHAGLFGSANDLAKLMQMYLQKGEYGGKTYLKSETITEFTRSQYAWEGLGNFRAVGFNRPLMMPKAQGHTAISVSQQSYGHTGFTGTYTWVDAQNGLLYIFLSNRVYPTRNNQRLMDSNIRTRILEKIYQLLQTEK